MIGWQRHCFPSLGYIHPAAFNPSLGYPAGSPSHPTYAPPSPPPPPPPTTDVSPPLAGLSDNRPLSASPPSPLHIPDIRPPLASKVTDARSSQLNICLPTVRTENATVSHSASSNFHGEVCGVLYLSPVEVK
ncbi:hypothetical protein RUM43_001983 [Polyplax serrata]|uniref:Uncharacterized protein n=1 Tax=Polyplax serrata TaxID=468196 RepID=A0AAN8NYM9_POLSC